MNTDLNLLFGVLALQADLIDAPQFVEACLLWTTRKHEHLADLLLQRGWIEPADRAHVEYLLERKVRKHGGDAHASLAAIPNDIRRSLAALADDDIQRSLGGGPLSAGSSLATIDHVPGPAERYSRLCLHASGGIGRVWLAHDRDLGRDVALKELRPEHLDHPTLGARFIQEAQVTGQLEHPGIIPVYDLVRARDGRQSYYTMRFVKGRTLSEAARAFHDKRLTGQADALGLPTLLDAFVTICNTVAYAHSRGVIHRDLKGQNVILGDFGEVVVLDWGLAKLVDRPDAEIPAPSVVLDGAGADSGYTMQGQALGTPAYMAPEQSAGRLDQIDRHTDVYGLGAILYEILTSAPPFSGDNTEEVLRKVCEEAPVPPRQLWPEVPSALEALCLRALAKRPADRPAVAADLAREVQGWQEYERRKAEEALRESEALYQSLVACLPCNVFRKDLEGRFTFANQRFCELVGRPLEELLGKTNFDINSRALAEKYRRDDQTVMETGAVFEDIEEHPGQIERFVHIMKTTVRDAAGNITGVQGISWDVTDRMLAEEERRKAEEALRESEAHYHSLVENLPCLVLRKDLEGRFTFANPRYCETMGTPLEQLLGRTDLDFFPLVWAEKYRRDDRKVVETGGVLEVIEEVPGDAGNRYFHVLKTAVRDAAGKVTGIQLIGWDVTTQKLAEEELARERHLFNCLMDTIPDIIIFKDLQGRYIRINASYATLFGMSQEQVLGKTVHDLFPADYARLDEEIEREIIRTGQAEVARDVHVSWPGGRSMWAFRTKMPLRDPQGNIIGTFVVARDITERKRAEEALRVSEERYRSVIAAMQDGILLLDADGSIRACNASAERILGISADQLMGRTPLDPQWGAIREDGTPFPDDDRPTVVSLRTGRPCSNVLMGVQCPDGSRTWVSVSSQPLFDPDGTTPAGVVACFTDVTERRRTEEILRQTTLELARLRQQMEASGK